MLRSLRFIIGRDANCVPLIEMLKLVIIQSNFPLTLPIRSDSSEYFYSAA